MPLLVPIEKGNEKWYEVVFWGYTDFLSNEEPRMLFRTIIPEDWLKTIGEHFLKSIDKTKDVKFTFKKYHYKEFGDDTIKKKLSAENLRYLG